MQAVREFFRVMGWAFVGAVYTAIVVIAAFVGAGLIYSGVKWGLK